MGRHSIRGVTSGVELNVRGTDAKRPKKHRISGGEYTTVRQMFFSPEPEGGYNADITYSIAPQGPNKPVYCDVRCRVYGHHHEGASVGQWYRPVDVESVAEYIDVDTNFKSEVPWLQEWNPMEELEKLTGFKVTGTISGGTGSDGKPLPGDDKVIDIRKCENQRRLDDSSGN